MKPLTRFTLLLLLLLVLGTTGAWADSVVVGQLQLFNTGTSDTLQLINGTGTGSPYPDTPLTLTDLQLTINGNTTHPSSVAPFNPDSGSTGIGILAEDLVPQSIRSLSLTGTLNGASTTLSVLVDGILKDIYPTISIVPYNGSALDTNGPCTLCTLDIVAQVVPHASVPEPSIVALFGGSLFFLRRRRAQVQ